MTAVKRLGECPETGCIRRAAHDIHLDAEGRTWAFRNVPEPEWVRRAKASALVTKDMTAA